MNRKEASDASGPAYVRPAVNSKHKSSSLGHLAHTHTDTNTHTHTHTHMHTPKVRQPWQEPISKAKQYA